MVSVPRFIRRRPDPGAFARSLRELREEHGIPGIAAVVLTSESVLNIGVDGVRKLGCPDSVRLGDRFHLGSNAKAMTGIVAGSPVEKGLISWSTRILDIFPAFAKTAGDAYRDKTLEDLLSHRARIVPFTSGTDFKRLPAFKGSPAEQREAFTGRILQRKPVDIVTTCGYTYSNAGYAIASAMLEKVSPKPQHSIGWRSGELGGTRWSATAAGRHLLLHHGGPQGQGPRSCNHGKRSPAGNRRGSRRTECEAAKTLPEAVGSTRTCLGENAVRLVTLVAKLTTARRWPRTEGRNPPDLNAAPRNRDARNGRRRHVVHTRNAVPGMEGQAWRLTGCRLPVRYERKTTC